MPLRHKYKIKIDGKIHKVEVNVIEYEAVGSEGIAIAIDDLEEYPFYDFLVLNVGKINRFEHQGRTYIDEYSFIIFCRNHFDSIVIPGEQSR